MAGSLVSGGFAPAVPLGGHMGYILDFDWKTARPNLDPDICVKTPGLNTCMCGEVLAAAPGLLADTARMVEPDPHNRRDKTYRWCLAGPEGTLRGWAADRQQAIRELHERIVEKVERLPHLYLVPHCKTGDGSRYTLMASPHHKTVKGLEEIPTTTSTELDFILAIRQALLKTTRPSPIVIAYGDGDRLLDAYCCGVGSQGNARDDWRQMRALARRHAVVLQQGMPTEVESLIGHWNPSDGL